MAFLLACPSHYLKSFITRSKFMKKLLATLAFAICTPLAAFAQTGSVTPVGIFTIPTKRPIDAKTPAGVTMSSLGTTATCGEKIKINVTLKYTSITNPTNVLVWGNFPQTTVNIPAGSGTITKAIEGNLLTCDKKAQSYSVLNVYAALGDTQAMQTKTFGASGTISSPPSGRVVPAEHATPDAVKLTSMQVKATCGSVPETVLIIDSKTDFDTHVFLEGDAASPLGGLVEVQGIAGLVQSYTFPNTGKKLVCEGTDINFQTAMYSRMFFGNTAQASTGNSSGLVQTIFGVGATAALPK
jgi:hypothetical protein